MYVACRSPCAGACVVMLFLPSRMTCGRFCHGVAQLVSRPITNTHSALQVLKFQKEKVTLNIGGTLASTARSTLLSAGEGSLFHTMFSGSHPMEADEEDGSFFIDRDGRHFYQILNFLRDPDAFQMPGDPVALRELLKEAEYYKLDMSSAMPPSAPEATPAPAPAPAPTLAPDTPSAVGAMRPAELPAADTATPQQVIHSGAAAASTPQTADPVPVKIWQPPPPTSADAGPPPVDGFSLATNAGPPPMTG